MMRKLFTKRGSRLSAIGAALMVAAVLPVAPAIAESSVAATCSMNAYTPYASSGKIWYGGSFSGCGTVDAHLRWAKPLGTTIIAITADATSGTRYSRACDWGTPANRNLYSRVETPTRSNGDSSSLATFNNDFDCKL